MSREDRMSEAPDDRKEQVLYEALQRPIRDVPGQGKLFDIEPDWSTYWWGMPRFEVSDARPISTVSVNFLTAKDRADFASKLGISISRRTDSIWWPAQEILRGEFEFTGPKVDSRYPVCIPSKGRANVQRTAKALDRMGVNYQVFVEETEVDLYRRHLRCDRVVTLPFHDLGQGSIPARNYIWEWAKERGYKRYWVVDDNIVSFARCLNNRRICVWTGGLFRAIEDFVDRYENIAFAGPHHKGFVPDRSPALTPILWNSRIYSCILVDTSLPYRWRGRYNEDTDICLRALKDGYTTALFRALLMDKGATQKTKGGNTDNVYNTGDSRFEFAESLRRQHPDVVTTVWRYGRWHHCVDYSVFKNNKPILKDGITPRADTNEFGMVLSRTRGAKNP